VTSDQKVWVPLEQGFVYPDATVFCGRAEPYAGTNDVLTNPRLIVEVLSPGTETFDRGDKFEGYRSIATLRHYLMVSSRHMLVEHDARSDHDARVLRSYAQGADVHIQHPDLSFTVDVLYAMALENGVS
jgi:Uma2 family endonuclease